MDDKFLLNHIWGRSAGTYVELYEDLSDDLLLVVHGLVDNVDCVQATITIEKRLRHELAETVEEDFPCASEDVQEIYDVAASRSMPDVYGGNLERFYSDKLYRIESLARKILNKAKA